MEKEAAGNLSETWSWTETSWRLSHNKAILFCLYFLMNNYCDMEGWHIKLTCYSSIFIHFFIHFEELGIMVHSSVPQIFWVNCKWPKLNAPALI